MACDSADRIVVAGNRAAEMWRFDRWPDLQVFASPGWTPAYDIVAWPFGANGELDASFGEKGARPVNFHA